MQANVIHRPCSPWPGDEEGKELGRLQRQKTLMALEGASMTLFMEHLGWTKEEVEAIIE